MRNVTDVAILFTCPETGREGVAGPGDFKAVRIDDEVHVMLSCTRCHGRHRLLVPAATTKLGG